MTCDSLGKLHVNSMDTKVPRKSQMTPLKAALNDGRWPGESVQKEKAEVSKRG